METATLLKLPPWALLWKAVPVSPRKNRGLAVGLVQPAELFRYPADALFQHIPVAYVSAIGLDDQAMLDLLAASGVMRREMADNTNGKRVIAVSGLRKMAREATDPTIRAKLRAMIAAMVANTLPTATA